MANNAKTGFFTVTIIATVLVIIGALNWGWIGLTSDNAISWLNNNTFRSVALERFIYILIGLAGLYLIFALWHGKKYVA